MKRTGDAHLPHDRQEPLIVSPKDQKKDVGLEGYMGEHPL